MGTRIAVFASGGGTNFQSVLDATLSHELPATVELLVVDRPSCGSIDRATSASVPVEIVERSTDSSFEDFDSSISDILMKYKIEFVVLAGYLKKIGPRTLKAVNGKMVNTHPSLLPKFGGPGMYGMNVHKAVVEAGEPVSGVTVHWVNENYDEGTIIAQKEVLVDTNDSAETLAERVRGVENSFYVSVLKSVLP